MLVNPRMDFCNTAPYSGLAFDRVHSANEARSSDPLLDKFDEYGVDELLDVNRRNTCKDG